MNRNATWSKYEAEITVVAVRAINVETKGTILLITFYVNKCRQNSLNISNSEIIRSLSLMEEFYLNSIPSSCTTQHIKAARTWHAWRYPMWCSGITFCWLSLHDKSHRLDNVAIWYAEAPLKHQSENTPYVCLDGNKICGAGRLILP
jgi:hypothetical protein